MNRLTHSPQGFLRSTQISQTKIFIFVEGQSDRYIYSKILESESKWSFSKYEIRTARELPQETPQEILKVGTQQSRGGCRGGTSGGKKVLLSFFDYLKTMNKLENELDGKITINFFFLDKDVDDLFKRLITSKHIVYTQMHSIENYLFAYGKIHDALAASASLDISSVRKGIGDCTKWRKCAAERVKPWLTLCLLSLRCKCDQCSYGSHDPPLFKGANGDVDECRLLEFKSRIKTNSSLTPESFEELFKKTSHEIDRFYKKDKHDLIFKGKWYASLLAKDAERLAEERHYDKTRLEDKIISSLAASMDWGEWTNQFKKPIFELTKNYRNRLACS